VKKVIGIFVLLVVICAVTASINSKFLDPTNIENTIRWTAFYGIISIGVAFVIITGGIDLSIGSVVGLSGSVTAFMLMQKGYGVAATLSLVFVISLIIGLAHGLLITKLKLQPFVVTLCGLLIYRGLARYLLDDGSLGFQSQFEGLKQLAKGKLPLYSYETVKRGETVMDTFGIPYPFIILALIAAAAILFLNFSIYGRYLYALGRNELAARYSGINTDRVVILSYVICSLLAGFAGILFALDINTVQPSGLGEFYELYAIAAAVLGGCSLRGGEGTIIGVIIGAAIMRVLYNAINILQIPTHVEFAIIGAVILAGVILDELLKRVMAKRRMRQRA